MFAAVQSVSIKGDISRNVERHVALVREAAGHGARFVLFPELSLIGYELAIACDAFVTHNDSRLDVLRTQAQELGVTIVAGAPYADERGGLRIAALSFLPDGRTTIYTKQHLHPGEDEVFLPGDGGELLASQGEKVALAVCADISQSSHAERAAKSGASVYAASVLISCKGYDTDVGLLRGYAKDFRMPVVMANHGGMTGGWVSAGRSGVWDAHGELVIAAPGDGECIVFAGMENGRWHGKLIGGPN